MTPHGRRRLIGLALVVLAVSYAVFVALDQGLAEAIALGYLVVGVTLVALSASAR